MSTKRKLELARMMGLACSILETNGHWSGGRFHLLSMGEKVEVLDWAIKVAEKDPANPSLSERMARYEASTPERKCG
jgi:hypothetical protein